VRCSNVEKGYFYVEKWFYTEGVLLKYLES
jgi:hypothetical protein